MSAKLLDERVVAVQPSLVRAFGMAPAVIVQQVHWHTSAGHGEELSDGEVWIPFPYDQVIEETGLKLSTIRRAMTSLLESGALKATQPTGYDRTKWYRIEYRHAAFSTECPSADSDTSKCANAQIEVLETEGSPSKTLKISTHARAQGPTIVAQEFRDEECSRGCGGSGVLPTGEVCACFTERTRP